MIDPKAQEMTVTVTFTYETPVYEDEHDMYKLASKEEEFLHQEFDAFLEGYDEAKNLKVSVKPKLL